MTENMDLTPLRQTLQFFRANDLPLAAVAGRVYTSVEALRRIDGLDFGAPRCHATR
ncbi:MAG: hypothetical protein ABSG68_10685 [Thermoguttaceae bacterium]|jgi:hypothetical protein